MEQAQTMLEQEKERIGVNAYRFHALKFIAESMAAKEEYAKAALLLAEAYKSFPVTEAAERDLAEAAATADAAERYAKYLHCTTIQYQPWERDTVPTLDEVRRLQERNYALREARKSTETEGNGVAEANEFINRFK